jgi:hypothetical protein
MCAFEEPGFDPAALANAFDEWSLDVESAERHIADFEAFLTSQETILDESEAELDVIERTHAGVEQWAALVAVPPGAPADPAARVEDAKLLHAALDSEDRLRASEARTVADYLRVVADLKRRLASLDALCDNVQ